MEWLIHLIKGINASLCAGEKIILLCCICRSIVKHIYCRSFLKLQNYYFNQDLSKGNVIILVKL